MSDSLNVIPGMYVSGQFTAKSPFNIIVNPDTYFTVEAVRTVSEMLGMKIDLYQTVFKPVGVSQDNTTTYLDELLKAKACIITLTQTGGPPVYVPSTYLTSSPLVDGVVFEHLCIIADCGSCSPDTKTKVDSTLQSISLAIQKNLGIKNPTVQVATLPQRGYVSKTQAEAWEKSRQLQIDELYNPIIENEVLTKQIEEYKVYITQLENEIKKNS